MFHGELRGMAGNSGDAAGIKAGNRPETLRPGVPQTAGRQQGSENARPNGDFLLYKNPSRSSRRTGFSVMYLAASSKSC